MQAGKIVYFNDKNFKDRLIPAPQVPDLEIIEHDIPKFDIPPEGSAGGNEPDPDQPDMFNESLTGNMEEEKNDGPDDNFVKRLLDSLDDEVD